MSDKPRQIKPVLIFCCLAATMAAEADTQAREFSGRFELMGRDATGGSDAAISPDGRFIVTSSAREDSLDLWMLEVATGRWQRLTDGATDEIEPQWSPDGRKIAYTATSDGNKDVWWLALRTGEHIRLTDSTYDDEYPSWAPDSRRVVFTTGPWKQRNFMVVDTERSADEQPPATKVNEESGHVGACSFHPDGESLLCHTYENGYGDIVHLALSGEVLSVQTQGEQWDYKPSTSKDGELIAFSRITGGSSSIWAKAYGSGEAFPVTSSLDNDRWPMFFRENGKPQLFFHRLVNQGSSVVILDRRSGDLQLVAGPSERPLQAVFAPGSRRLAYCAVLDGRNVIKIFDRDSESMHLLETGFRDACYPAWSPRGRRLAFLARDLGTWQLATIDLDSGAVIKLTDERALPNGITGPVDWSDDGARIVFTANTAAYESDVFVVVAETGELLNLTNDPWYDESPSWDSNGDVLFMSTRGGGWTWGLFRMQADRPESIEVFAGPDYVEKNYPKSGANRLIVWSEYRMCDGTQYTALKEPGEDAVLLRGIPGARWPSLSNDGNELLVTQVRNYVEFWKVAIEADEVDRRTSQLRSLK